MDEVIFKFFYPSLIIAGLAYKGLAFFEKNDADEKSPDENSVSALLSAIALIISAIAQLALCFYLIKYLAIHYFI